MEVRRLKISGFSLIEVIMAVGIFAVAVSAMIGLLPSLTRQSTISNDTLTALRLPDAIRVELERMALAGGFDNLAGQTKSLALPLPETCLLVAARDASRVHAVDYQPPSPASQLPVDAHYFLIEVWSFSGPPLGFETGGATLALHLRISWPYRIPGSPTATALNEREKFDFNLALNR